MSILTCEGDSCPVWFAKQKVIATEIYDSLDDDEMKYGLNIKVNLDYDFSDITLDSIVDPKRTISIPDEIIAIDLPLALKEHEYLVRKTLMTLVSTKEKLNALHFKNLKSGVFMVIPDNFVLDEPMRISSLISGGNIFDHLIIIVGKNSRIKFIDDISSLEKGAISENETTSYVSKIVEIFAEENSKIDYISLQALNSNTVFYTRKFADQGRDATVNWFDIQIGSKLAMSDVSSFLSKPGAYSENKGVFFGTGNQTYDLVTQSFHIGENTYSNIDVKGALSGSAKGIYRGLIQINPDAAGSNGYQKESTLILSEDAVGNAIPNLKIHNHDVKCSHSSTVGKPDKEKLFYMMSRGLSKKQALQEYVKGFFSSLVSNIGDEKIEEDILGRIEAIVNSD